MAKKDTKLENLSKTVHMLVEEIRLSETEGLDRLFMDVYSQQAGMMTDSRQQGKVKHAFKDILGIVFFGVLAGNDEWDVGHHKMVFRLFSFSTCYPVTVHSVPVTGKNPCKICFANGFLLATATFSHGLSSKC